MQVVWVTIKFTAPRQDVNLLARSSDDEAKSELQAAETARDLRLELKSVAMTLRICCVSGSKVGKCGLASS